MDNPSHVGDPAPPPGLPNNNLANHIADILSIRPYPFVNVFTLTPGSDPTTAISTIITAADNDVVDTIYVLISSTITTRPTSVEIKASGTWIDGNVPSLNVGGLTPNQTYYGWNMVVDKTGNKSLIVASIPAILKTDGDFFGDTMFNTDLNAAYSLRKLFR